MNAVTATHMEPHHKSIITGVEFLANKASRKRKANSKSKTAQPTNQPIRVRLPKQRKNEIFARAELMLGANHIRVRCFDGITRTGRIKGKIKKRMWIREGDLIIVVPWSFQDTKCDIIFRYVRPQAEFLHKNGYI